MNSILYSQFIRRSLQVLLFLSLVIFSYGSYLSASAQQTFAQSDGQIAFVSNRDGNFEIYLMNIDETGITRLTNNTAKDESPSWSPDGSRIVFHSNRVGYDQIYTMNADGSNQSRLITSSVIDEWPYWSPSDNKIVFSRIANHNGDGNRTEVFIANSDGSNVTRLTYSSGTSNGYNNGAWPSGWSPDGSKILFYWYREGYDQLWIMNTDGSNQHKLTTDNYWNAIPTMSPDGTIIAFASYRNGNYEIYTINSDGTNATRLTNIAAEDWRPNWSQDGSKILFESKRAGETQIYSMNTDGSQQTRLTSNNSYNGQQAWRPSSNASNIVSEARLDKGMPYSSNRGCSSPYTGCGGPYHGFYKGVCTDLVVDGYNAGASFNIQNALYQDYRNNPGRYRYGSARNAEDMRRYFSYNQSFLSHSQPYQPGDVAFFDWDGDGLTNHVLVISEVDASSRPLKMVDASGVIPSINPSGLAFEHSWSSYYEQHVQGHARLGSINLTTTAALTEILQILRVTVNSASVGLSLFDSNGKSVSEVYDENLVANNIETSIPYIPGGSYVSLGTQKVITVTQPLSNTNQYFARVEGQANTTYTLLIETLQDASVTASQTFTQAIGAGETQNAGITITAPSGVISFTTQSPTSSPVVNLPSSLSLGGLVGTSAQLTFTISETGGQQAIDNASVTATDLSTQYGIKILSSQLTITPTNFSVAAGSNQQVSVEVNLANLDPGEYLGSLILTSQSGSPVMIPFTLQVQYNTLYLPSVIRN